VVRQALAHMQYQDDRLGPDYLALVFLRHCMASS